jgi:hypothetical protein
MSRLGLHYFPDTIHYRQSDLETWLPELHQLNVGWLVLRSETSRAIPEAFLDGLLQAGIHPLIEFNLSLTTPPAPNTLIPLLDAYAQWGVRYLLFFNRPNQRSSWPNSTWTRQNPVERFLDLYLPFATLALERQLSPLFPPLQPGGSYWDTVFLRTALASLNRRKQTNLLNQLILTAYAWTHNKPLNWGHGGPERWPQASPYITPSDSQDQCGFCIFDWYTAIAQSELGHPSPIILLQAGQPTDPTTPSTSTPSQQSLPIAHLALGELYTAPNLPRPPLANLPENVLACCMWLLSASPDSIHLSQAWYPSISSPQPWVEQLKACQPPDESIAKFLPTQQPIFEHYILLPNFDWGVPDWHLDFIRPLIKKYRPTIGFSLHEASLARRVTVIANEQAIPEEDLNALRFAGCRVERITEPGIDLAPS